MTFSYNSNIPAAGNDPADDQPLMQTNFASISSLVAIDHVGFNIAGGGEHAQVTFNANHVPSIPTSPPVLFTNNDASSIPQLFYYSGNAAHTSSNYVASSNGSTMLLGGIVIKWGDCGTVTSGGTAVSFTSAFPNSCFHVFLQTYQNGSATTRTVNVDGSTVTTSGFTAYATANINARYFAIGR